jgi:hypothetical protein
VRQEESVALELSERPTWDRSSVTISALVDARTSPLTNPLNEHTVELREWLTHLEDWVETQLVATRALVAMLDDGNITACTDGATEQHALDALST